MNLPEQFNEMEQVVNRLVRGMNPTEIAKDMGIPRTRVLSHRDSWQQFSRQELDIAQRAKEVLAGADRHYDMLLQEAWRVLEDAKNSGSTSAQKDQIAALNTLHNIEKTRVGLYAQAGATADDTLAAEMVETQRKQEVLIDALKKLCPNCRKAVAQHLSEVTNRTTEIVTVVEIKNDD